MLKGRRITFILATIGLAAATSASADVSVSGPPKAVELTATQSTVKEALQRLSATYGLELHGVEDLNEPLSGSFKGPLTDVVDQLLSRQDHYMRPNGAGMALFVTAPKPEAPAPASASAEQPADGDPVKADLEKQITLSPAGQETAVKMFGEKGRYLQVDEALLQSFYSNRGGRRFIAGAARSAH